VAQLCKIWYSREGPVWVAAFYSLSTVSDLCTNFIIGYIHNQQIRSI